MLALLAMHADRVAPTDLIVEARGATLPRQPAGKPQVYVSHLGQLLDPVRTGRPPTVLVSAAHGTA